MASRVSTRLLYRHPKTRKLIKKETALAYMRRTRKKIKPEKWLVVTQHFTPQEISAQPSLKRYNGRIQQAVRLVEEEKILKISSIDERRFSTLLAKHKVYKSLVENWGGEIRMTISGVVEGRKVKEVIHMAYHRGNWGFGALRPDNVPFTKWVKGYKDRYEEFKQWILGAILSNLRRRGLRVSNSKESQKRIRDLTQKRRDILEALDTETNADVRGGLMERLKWATDSVRVQKKTRQMTKATLRIEKLA